MSRGNGPLLINIPVYNIAPQNGELIYTYLSPHIDQESVTPEYRQIVTVQPSSGNNRFESITDNPPLTLYRQELSNDHVNTLPDHPAVKPIHSASPDTIHRLALEIDYLNKEIGNHIKRIGCYSAAIAHRLGLNDKTIEIISLTAPLHDIGKIGIPDSILLKPAALDKDERAIIQQHTIIGANILEFSYLRFSRLARIIALSHHERWDGSGYPTGLKGSNIPLLGRITAIADVFDALTSERPYKEPYSVDKSLDIIREERGRHFDPEVTDAFFDIKDQILAIRDNYQDGHQTPLMQVAGLDQTIASSSYPVLTLTSNPPGFH